MDFFKVEFGPRASNNNYVDAVNMEELIKIKGENYIDCDYPIENAKIAGIQVYYTGQEEGVYELFLEKSEHAVRYTEKFKNYANRKDELFDTFRQTQEVFCGSYLDDMKKLFTALVNEIYEVSQFKTPIASWDQDAMLRAFVGYENEDGDMEYIVTANYIVTPAMFAILKTVASKTDKGSYDKYWEIFSLADTSNSEAERSDITKSDLEDWEEGFDDLEEGFEEGFEEDFEDDDEE